MSDIYAMLPPDLFTFAVEAKARIFQTQLTNWEVFGKDKDSTIIETVKTIFTNPDLVQRLIALMAQDKTKDIVKSLLDLAYLVLKSKCRFEYICKIFLVHIKSVILVQRVLYFIITVLV